MQRRQQTKQGRKEAPTMGTRDLCSNALAAVSVLLFGPLPADKQNSANDAISIAQAVIGMSKMAQNRAFDFTDNGFLDEPLLQPRFAALDISQWIDDEEETKEDDP